ncbi:MAG: hypothetical protein JOZ78_03095 [Chroococcidiopsidaceae cyanobacterium CP_BM_ER_R8_30]|nr:hypothetical protein [Chroococcidiopsidaceae cyanobacterium CP_BM_ER_R8_30]
MFSDLIKNFTKQLSSLRDLPTKKDFENAATHHQENAVLLRAADFLTKNRSSIVKNAMQELYEKHPELQVASNPDGSDLNAAYIRNIDSYVEALTDSLVVGDPKIVGKISSESELPPDQQVEVLKYIKSCSGLTGQAEQQAANTYIDHIISATQEFD